MSLSTGAQNVMLPGGLATEDGRVLRNAAVRPLTGVEEDWLAQEPEMPSVLKVTRLLGSCVVAVDGIPGSPELARKLLAGDRDFLMLRIREATLGRRIQAVVRCPACEQLMDVEIDTSEVSVEHRPQSGKYRFRSLDRTLEFRLPNGGDLEAVRGLEVAKAVEALLKRCVTEDGNLPLQPSECDALADAMERVAPLVDVELDVVCPECGHSFLTPFDTTAFFFEEMRLNHSHLLREFHTLAMYYHWAERDIMGLRRDRRRAYLDLLQQALRRD